MLRNTGYTTRMLESGFDWYEEAHAFPVCFVAKNMDIANMLKNVFLQMAVDRGHTVYLFLNRVELDSGAKFRFVSEQHLDRQIRGINWADILFDNSCVNEWGD